MSYSHDASAAGCGTGAAQRLSAAQIASSSPRPVIRGENIPKRDDSVQGPTGSVRVNLSVPRTLDNLLSTLSGRSGMSKAAFVMQALTWYQPQLENLAADLTARNAQGPQYPEREKATDRASR